MSKGRALLVTALVVTGIGCSFPDYSVDASIELQPDSGQDTTGADTSADGTLVDATDGTVSSEGGPKTCLELGGAVYGDHCYWVIPGTSQPGAKIVCAASGGHLATISTPAENDFVFKLASSERWIGLQAALPSSKRTDFTWVTGEPKPFEFWGGTAPSGAAACVTINGPTGNWFDRNCGSAVAAACERDTP